MRAVVLIILCLITWNGFSQQAPFQDALRGFDRFKGDSTLRRGVSVLDSLTATKKKYWADSLREIADNNILTGRDTSKLQSPLDTLTGARVGLVDSIPSGMLEFVTDRVPANVEEIGMPNLPAVPEVKSISGGLGIKDLPTAEVPSIAIPKDIQNSVGDLQGQLPNSKSLSAAIDGGMTEGTNFLSEDLGFAQDIEGNMTKLSGVPKVQDPQVMKEMAFNKAKETATNHFRGHEQQLIAAMSRFAEARSKIKEPEGVIDMLAKRSNRLKSKKTKDRLIGGVMFQYQQMGGLLIDINPFCLYRFTHYLNGGLGWNQRIAFDKWHIQPDGLIFGPRTTVELNLRSFAFLVLDAELMNARPRSLLHGSEMQDRVWVASYFGGIRTKFRITKSLIGNTSVLYNLLDRSHQSPYADKLNVRFGFEVFHEK